MKITLSVDLQEHETLAGEFGLSFLLESAAGDFLFDTGADTALQKNLSRLGIPADKIKRVILSHGHYDHTGGLAYLLPEEIFCCSNITQSHYSYHGKDDIHNIAMPEAAQKILARAKVNYIDKFTEIAPGVYLTGSIPRNSGEDPGGKFFHDEACFIPDIVSEEQALLTADGVLITGCCHAGIINTMEYCQSIHPEIKIHSIVGGLHLRHASEQRLAATADYLRSSNVKELYLLHCTGANAIEFLQSALPDCKITSPQLGESWTC